MAKFKNSTFVIVLVAFLVLGVAAYWGGSYLARSGDGGGSSPDAAKQTKQLSKGLKPGWHTTYKAPVPKQRSFAPYWLSLNAKNWVLIYPTESGVFYQRVSATNGKAAGKATAVDACANRALRPYQVTDGAVVCAQAPSVPKVPEGVPYTPSQVVFGDEDVVITAFPSPSAATQVVAYGSDNKALWAKDIDKPSSVSVVDGAVLTAEVGEDGEVNASQFDPADKQVAAPKDSDIQKVDPDAIKKFDFANAVMPIDDSPEDACQNNGWPKDSHGVYQWQKIPDSESGDPCHWVQVRNGESVRQVDFEMFGGMTPIWNLREDTQSDRDVSTLGEAANSQCRICYIDLNGDGWKDAYVWGTGRDAYTGTFVLYDPTDAKHPYVMPAIGGQDMLIMSMDDDGTIKVSYGGGENPLAFRVRGIPPVMDLSLIHI